MVRIPGFAPAPTTAEFVRRNAYNNKRLLFFLLYFCNFSFFSSFFMTAGES